MHFARCDRRDTRHKPSRDTMRASRRRELAGHSAKLDLLQVRTRRRRESPRARATRHAHLVDHLEKQWPRAGAADKRGVAPSIEIPNPNREDVGAEDADGLSGPRVSGYH